MTKACNVSFHTNDCWNFLWMVPVIGMESMVKCARLRYTGGNLTPDICSLIKPAAIEKLMPFPTKIHAVML